MRGLVLDQGLPRSTAPLLRGRGRHVVHVGERGMAQATDEAILEYARAEELAVVTLDADFHALLAMSGAQSASVTRLRVQGLKAQETADLIESAISRAQPELHSGALVSATRKLVRIKRLPIAKRVR